jgi:hypothetical protein
MIYVLGGSEAYTGRDLYQVHKVMVERQGLRDFHFDLVMQVRCGRFLLTFSADVLCWRFLLAFPALWALHILLL